MPIDLPLWACLLWPGGKWRRGAERPGNDGWRWHQSWIQQVYIRAGSARHHNTARLLRMGDRPDHLMEKQAAGFEAISLTQSLQASASDYREPLRRRHRLLTVPLHESRSEGRVSPRAVPTSRRA